MKKHLFGLLLALFLSVGLLPTVALAEGEIPYLDETGARQNCTSATVVTSSDTTWTSGWYVVNSNVTIGTAEAEQRVTVEGEVHLILADDCTLTVNGGIQVEGDTRYSGVNALTIYAQSTGNKMGKLIAQNAAYGYAAIGGGRGEQADTAGGIITINGGNVSATSENPSAAIGGGGRDGGAAGGNITINGGIVTATSRGLGAGIGGNGGPVNAGSGGIITITGGIVRAESNESTGIGGGTKHPSTLGNSGKITITGGTITAITNSTNAPGIGGNDLKDSNNSITIANGKAVVFSTSISNKANQDSWSGIIFEGNEGKVYGSSVTPVVDFTIDSGKNLCIPEGSVLNISGISATNEGGIYVAGTLSGSPLGGNLYYPLVLTSDIAADKAYSYGGKTYGKAGETITLTGTNIPVGNKAIWNTTPTVTFAGDSFSMPAEKMTITATYAPKTYQITYNTNGGDSVSSGTYTYGTGATLPTNIKKAGYTFKGWYASSALTGNPVTTIGPTETGDKAFWAKWKANTYTVKFDTDGGSAIADKTMQWEDTVLTGVATPTKTGWEFLGWKYNDAPVNANTKYSDLGVADTVQYVQLKAQWKDVAAPVISGVENGKTYCLTRTVTVSDNVGVVRVTVDGTPVTVDSNNQFVLSPKETPQAIIAKDAAGNTSAKMIVTVNSEHKGGTATCVKKATCIHCGTQYGPLDRDKHNLEYIPAEGATVTATGNKEYWHCKDCGKYFSDENGMNSVALSDTVISKLPPSIIDGAGQSLTAGEWKELTFRSNAAFADFVRVELDGHTVESSRYTVKEGSTIVSLKADYVRTLSAGEHTLGIVSTNGTATTTFTIHASAASDNSQASPEGNVSASVNTPSANKNPLSVPPTGDDSPLGLWVVALVVSGVLLNILGVVLKKRRSKK